MSISSILEKKENLPGIGLRRDVREAADVTVIALDASSVLHPAVRGGADHHHLTRRTLRTVRLPLTRLLVHCKSTRILRHVRIGPQKGI